MHRFEYLVPLYLYFFIDVNNRDICLIVSLGTPIVSDLLSDLLMNERILQRR